jgi:hypothetical protein
MKNHVWPEIQAMSQIAQGTYLTGVLANSGFTEDHKGHIDRIFEQELTEETDDKSTHSIAGGYEAFYLCSLLLSPSIFVSSVTFCKKKLIERQALNIGHSGI